MPISPPEQMSRATSFSSMRSSSPSASAWVSAPSCSMPCFLRGASPADLGVGDVHMAFVAVTILCLLCLPFFLRLLPRAGAEVSGHRRALAPAVELEPRPSADSDLA